MLRPTTGLSITLLAALCNGAGRASSDGKCKQRAYIEDVAKQTLCIGTFKVHLKKMRFIFLCLKFILRKLKKDYGEAKTEAKAKFTKWRLFKQEEQNDENEQCDSPRHESSTCRRIKLC